MHKGTGTRSLWGAAAVAVLALCGVFLVTSGKAADGQDLRVTDTLDLSELVHEQVERTDELEQRANELGAKVDDLTTNLGEGSTQGVQQEIDDVLATAGLGAVEGAGLTVTLDDGDIPDNLAAGEASDYLVHQQDVDAVINALWSGGAEAMTVMGHRVTMNSVVKCVGPVINVDAQVYSPPYTISAIGDFDSMVTALGDSEQVSNYLEYVRTHGLGWEVQSEDNLNIASVEDSAGRAS